MVSVHFRSSSFDPKLLISQIVSLQCLYYSYLCCLVIVLSLLFPSHGLTLQHLFCFDSVGVSSVPERINACIFVINSILMALSIWILVGRSKLCTDFSFTLFLYHWLISWLFPTSWSSFPWKWSWYCLHLVCALLTTVLAEYLCIRTELRAVPVGSSASSSSSSSNTTSAPNGSSQSASNAVMRTGASSNSASSSHSVSIVAQSAV